MSTKIGTGTARRSRRRVATAAGGPDARWWSLIGLAAGASGMLASIPELPGALVGVLLVIFIAMGPGSAVRAWVRLPRHLTALTVPAVGVAAVLLASTFSALSGAWAPPVMLLVLSAATVAAAGARRLRPFAPLTARRRSTTQLLTSISTGVRDELRRVPARFALAFAVLSVALLLVSLPAIAGAEVHPFGLLFAAPVTFFAALVLAPLSVCLAIIGRGKRIAWIGLLATIAVLRLPGSVATEVPPYSWTYKLFGVVDYIAEHGGVAKDVDIYHSWPGLFAATAWFGELTGMPVMTIAHAFTPLYHVAFVLAVYLLARTLTLAPESALIAALIAEITNWVGQDYFSPQAVALLLAIVVIALLIRSVRQPPAAWIALAVFAALTVTHQLTPYWLLGVVALLTLLRRIRPRGIVIAFAAFALGYLLLQSEAVAGLGPLVSLNAAQNVQTTDYGTGSDGYLFTSLACRAVALALWAGAALAAVSSLWKHRSARGNAWVSTWVASVVAFSPLALLLAQGYGGEALFRVFLYSIPGCALLIAPWVAAMLTSERRLRRPFSLIANRQKRKAGSLRPVTVTVMVTLIALLGAQASLGAWFTNLVSKESYFETQRILEEADTGTLVLPIGPGAPSRMVARYADFARVNEHFDLGLDVWEGWQGESFQTTDRTEKFTRELLEMDQPALVIITEQMKRRSDYYGTFATGGIARFEQQLLADDRWQPVQRSDTLTVVQLKNVG